MSGRRGLVALSRPWSGTGGGGGRKPRALVEASYLVGLRRITDDLLRLERPGEFDEAAAKLYALLEAASGMDAGGMDSPASLNTPLSIGGAISSQDAARCVLDSARTSKFLRGIVAAIQAAQQRFPGGPIEILYAGCGPFATLALPLTTRFTADQIRFTLLDVDPRSLESARQVVQTFGLQGYVREVVQCDAAAYVHPGALHMVITETMQRALGKEPQVAITLNLAPQLCPGGIFIPEKVSVDAFLCDLRTEFWPQTSGPDEPARTTRPAGAIRIHLGKVFELTAETASDLVGRNGARGNDAEAELPAATIDLPEEVADGQSLMLATTITVFDSIVLREFESGLTYPMYFHDFSIAGCAGKIEFLYSLNGDRGFRWRTPA